MITPQWAALIAPIVVALIASGFGYRQVVKTAAQRRAVEDRNASLSEYDQLNKALSAEIDRVRTDWEEDRERFRAEIDNLRAEMRWLRRERADQIRRDLIRTHFDRAMVAWVNEWLPRARRLGMEVPDPPQAPELPHLIDPQLLDPEDTERGHHRRWDDR